jgi:effector-binding domain-containing protein
MKVEIIDKPLSLILYGFSGIAMNKDYAGTALKLTDRLWQIVKSNNLDNKGLNIWVYDQNESMFAGVELNEVPNQDTGLEQKNITLSKYASYKHMGPYHQIGRAVQNMTEELKRMGLQTSFPYIEIYGHWTSDEAKQETELLFCL